MTIHRSLLPRVLLLLAACPGIAASAEVAQASQGLRAAETGFAQAMAERDLAAFAAYVADDAVFINGGKPLRGRAAVVEYWKRFFEKPQAPFAWKPEIVEVTQAGRLGYSEGPVSTPDGTVVSRYYSTWRQDAQGTWKVVFDNGYDLCKCPRP